MGWLEERERIGVGGWGEMAGGRDRQSHVGEGGRCARRGEEGTVTAIEIIIATRLRVFFFGSL